MNHQQKCLINGIGTFGIKSNYFGPVIPKKLKGFGKLNDRVINLKNEFL